MKGNLITLHEAVVIVLLKEPQFKGSFSIIAERIEKRELFTERKGNILLSEQIRLRTSIASSRYKSWFEYFPPDTIRLRLDPSVQAK